MSAPIVDGNEPFHLVTCSNVECGVRFYVSDSVYSECRRLGERRVFHCPNGHRQYWRETEAERLRARVAELERNLAFDRERADKGWRVAAYWKGIAHRRRP